MLSMLPDNTDAVLRSITTLVASVSGNITGPVATEHLFTINAGGSVLAAADLTATNADFSLAQFSAVEFVRAAGSIAGDVEATAGSIERVRLVNPGNISGQSIDGNIIAAEHIGSIFSSGGIGVNGLRL